MNLRDLVSGLFGESDPRLMPRHFFWDVRRMDYKTAQRADISKQNCTVCPRHWYVDATFVCRDCGREFVFAASEQRFWYEEKRFYVDSIPKACSHCRRAERTRVEFRRRYDALVTEALGRCSDEMKREVVTHICDLETMEDTIPERMQENRARLLKQLDKTEGATAGQSSKD